MTNKYSKHSPADGGSESIINLSKRYYPYQAGSEIKNTNSFNLSPPSYGHHDLLEEYSLYKSRSESRSSSSSANSTGTVCESEIFPYGAGIKPHQPHQRMLRSTSPPSRTVTPPPTESKTNKNKPKANDESQTSGELESKLSEKRQGKRQSVKAAPAVATSDLLIDNGLSRRETSPDKTSVSTASSLGLRARMEPPAPAEVDDVQSVSTVSGSGIEFFRKFVQRKGASCKDCEDQFRREVLIDRLVSDSLNTKAVRSSSKISSSSASSSVSYRPTSELSDTTQASMEHSLIVSSLGMRDMETAARACASRCRQHCNSVLGDLSDAQSVSTKSSLSRSSSISGSGLLFLRNYLKKKKSKTKPGQAELSDGSAHNKNDAKNISAFNIIPVPFPPPSDFYGPVFLPDGGSDSLSDQDSSSSRRHSVCSTVADLLNEDFDCDDSELKNLDWEEWDEPLPDEMSYDDLVSVISESFYSEDLDLSELCELDWEGRKTVVANESQVLSPDDRRSQRSDNIEGRTAELGSTPGRETEAGSAASSTSTSTSRYKTSSFRSSRFLQDLEAELELPPMTPVSDEKEEAVRALSRSIKQYMRTGSDGSYTSSGPDRQSRSATAEELERNSRMSVHSPAMSDYLPELVSTNSTNSSCVSPVQTPYRRPLSQLLIYDGPSYDTPPPSQAYTNSRISRERSKTPLRSPEVKNSDSSGQTRFSSGFGFSQNSALNKSIYAEGKAGASLTQESPINKVDISSCEASPAEQSRLFDQLRLRKETTKVANRDSLLCPYTPPLCGSPGLPALHSPNVSRQPFIRHSSTDSGCHLLEEKLTSLSPTPPTPSPRTNIESLLSSNRNKLATFWEKSVSNSTPDAPHSWLPNKDLGHDGNLRQGFKPFKSAFGSENSLIVSDRLSQFQDMTRRAAGVAERNCRGRNYPHARSHRASTGSDCSDFLDKITLSPAQPRRRESFTEYFV